MSRRKRNTKYIYSMHIMFNSFLFVLLFTGSNVNAVDNSAESRLKFIEKLINTSSGARQIIESDDQNAKKLREEADRLYVLSKKEFDSGDKENGSKLLNRATVTMFKAIKLATPESLGKDKKKNDFYNRKKSVDALHDAFNRIAKHESDKESSNQVSKQVQQLESDAVNLFSAGKDGEARVELDKAYHFIKVSIEALRRGKTLVRSLNFSSKEEEYYYEVDRNDTHKMLIRILLKNKLKSAYTSKMISMYTSSSDDIRKEAEIAAENDNYEEAVKLLEQSTIELVRAIRSAGVYIPG